MQNKFRQLWAHFQGNKKPTSGMFSWVHTHKLIKTQKAHIITPLTFNCYLRIPGDIYWLRYPITQMTLKVQTTENTGWAVKTNPAVNYKCFSDQNFDVKLYIYLISKPLWIFQCVQHTKTAFVVINETASIGSIPPHLQNIHVTYVTILAILLWYFAFKSMPKLRSIWNLAICQYEQLTNMQNFSLVCCWGLLPVIYGRRYIDSSAKCNPTWAILSDLLISWHL